MFIDPVDSLKLTVFWSVFEVLVLKICAFKIGPSLGWPPVRRDQSWSSMSHDLLKSIAHVQGSSHSYSTAAWPNLGRRYWEIQVGLHGWIQLANIKTTRLRGPSLLPPQRSAYPVSTQDGKLFPRAEQICVLPEAGRTPGEFLSILNLSPLLKPYLFFLSLSHPLPSSFCLKEAEPLCLYPAVIKTDIRQLRISAAASTQACPLQSIFKTIPSKLFHPTSKSYLLPSVSPIQSFSPLIS